MALKIRKWIGLVFGLLFVLRLDAQQINYAEYFFDQDPGRGNGTDLAVTSSNNITGNYNISTGTLNPGIHKIYIRTRTTDGKWSLNSPQVILINNAPSSQSQITKAEYFIDNDPGIGAATPITLTSAATIDITQGIGTSSLASGIHVLYVRAKNSLGKWSLASAKVFYLQNSLDYPIVGAEYFFESDPGLGQGTAISLSSANTIDLNTNINTSSLTKGLHPLNIRVMDNRGKWSLSSKSLIYLANPIASRKISAAEYFFDTDPGFGNGSSISISAAENINVSTIIPTTNLSSGIHYLNIRVKDQNGKWSLIDRIMVYLISGALKSPRIVSTEYFFDQDPGQGNGNAISHATADLININHAISSNALGVGMHHLFIRTKDSLNRWSMIDQKMIYVSPEMAQQKIVAIEYAVDTVLAHGQGTLISIAPTDTFNDIFTFNHGLIDTNYHILYLRVKSQNGSWSFLDSIHFRLASCAIPVASFSLSDVCLGDSLTLTNLSTNTDTITLYKWDIYNDGNIESTDSIGLSYLIGNPGIYKVKLEVSNYVCIDTAIQTVKVFPRPVSLVSLYGDSTFCPGSFSVLSANTGIGYQYEWLKNKQSINGANSSFYQALDSGDYNAVIKNIYNCVDTSKSVHLNLYPLPVANLSLSGSSDLCYGDTLTINAPTGTGLTYQWYKNGSISTNDTLSYIEVNEAGSYKVRISNANNCYNESNPLVINVHPLPFVNIIPMGSTAFCQGDSVVLLSNSSTGFNYQWYNGSTLLGNNGPQISVKNTSTISLKITDAYGCSSISSSFNVVSYPIPTATFNLDTITCAKDTLQIQYTGNASSIAFYNWNFDGATVINGSGQGPYSLFWNTSGNKQITLKVSENGCASGLNTTGTLVNSIQSQITSANTSVCQGDSVLLYANSGTNYQYQWYLGGIEINGASNSSLTVLNSGNYTVKVTDPALGCSNISVAQSVNVNTTNFNIAFIANTTTFTQPPFAVSFTNQTPNMSNYQFEWDLGDGSNSTFYNPGHSYSYNGNYSVSLYAEDMTTGCRDTLIKNDYIHCSGGAPNPCNILAAITPSGPVTLCNGDSILLSASTGMGYGYQWVFNNLIITGATAQTYMAKQAGTYRVVVTDAQCSQTSPAFVLIHYPSIQPVIQATGQLQPCTVDSLKLYLLVNYNSYNWTTSETSSTIWVKNTGYYQVAVTDNFGCNMLSQPYVVNNSFLNPPGLCIVGVDSFNHNQLVWERDPNNLIDSFYVYRESYMAGVYNKIGALDFNDNSIFIDYNSNPAIQAYKYKIAAVDTCGGVTLLSDHHKTIHLTINAGLNGSWNLIWDGYQGFSFSTYRIYRGTNAQNLMLLTQLPSTATSYTDLNPPSGNVFYQIEVIKNSGCYPDTIAKANTNYNSSRSNTANNGNIAPIYLTADFSGDILTGQWPVQVQFTDNSSGMPNSWHWNFGDGNTSIEQNPVHTYNNTGVYTVSLKVCNGTTCDTLIKTNYVAVLPNGLVEIGIEMSAKIYPNPNDGKFILEINDNSTHHLHLTVFNILGETVHSENFDSNGITQKPINLSHLSKGVYFVNLGTSDKIVYQTKVVIE